MAGPGEVRRIARAIVMNNGIESRRAMPAIVTPKPAMMRVRCGRRLAKRSAPSDDASNPAVAAVKITPVWMAS
jgi:hypothetical protein